ncbi:hypothetical protein BC940DRAFT_234783, partial [Gongronella butleri]
MSTTQEDPPGVATAWTTIVRRSMERTTVPHMLMQRTKNGLKTVLKFTDIYVNQDHNAMWINQRATTITQNRLMPGTILFEFKSSDVEHTTDIYDALTTQIGPLLNKGARPISMYGSNKREDLIIQTQFEKNEDNERAIRTGVVYKGITYKATKALPTTDKDVLKNVAISQIPCNLTNDEIIKGLQVSLAYYGKVARIRKTTNRGYFEGDVSVTLDTT